MHIHSNHTWKEWPTSPLKLYPANGVTTILNNGDFGESLPLWAAQVVNGSKVGPTIYSFDDLGAGKPFP